MWQSWWSSYTVRFGQEWALTNPHDPNFKTRDHRFNMIWTLVMDMISVRISAKEQENILYLDLPDGSFFGRCWEQPKFKSLLARIAVPGKTCRLGFWMVFGLKELLKKDPNTVVQHPNVVVNPLKHLKECFFLQTSQTRILQQLHSVNQSGDTASLSGQARTGERCWRKQIPTLGWLNFQHYS